MASERDPCVICLREIAGGQAIFTAECFHTFHNRCIARNVAHGRRVCPLCNARWRDVPAPSSSAAAAEPDDDDEPPLYADDDPVEPAGGQDVEQAAAAAATGGDAAAALVIKAHCEYPAVARDASRDNFAVLLHAKAVGAAAGDAQRAPLDLVTVLDVSWSMEGRKLELVKKAIGFVIDNLGRADRLCVVTFSTEASRRTPLLRMSEVGKATAKRTVESLVANGSTDIGQGLRVAARVLGDRRHRNPVSSIILLSDGQDTVVDRYMDLVPSSFTFASATGGRLAPIHTFGFGTDHDAAAMNTIAESTGGTFSFVENQAVIQDSFAQCIGGLLSVTVQDARIAVTCSSPGVLVREIKSGRYESRVDADGRAASVDVGELYADEERRFLLFIDVPSADATEDNATQLINLTCTYRCTVTGRAIDAAGEDAVVQRPLEVTAADQVVSVEVERERVRVEATEDIAIARAAAERGDHAEAARTLQLRRQAVEGSALGHAGDPTCEALADELCELEEWVADAPRYARMGRACMLAGMSSHGLQRASGTHHKVGLIAAARTGRLKGAGGGRGRGGRLYKTPRMENMVCISRKSREQPQQKRSGGGQQMQQNKRKKL